MTIRRFVVTATTDASGDAEAYTPYFSGRLVSVRYVKTDFASGVDLVVTSDEAGETIWAEDDVNASATRYPRAPTHSTAGAAALYASAGEAVNGRIAIGSDRLKVVVSDGGDTKVGTFHFTVDA